jgi:dienelactone hydrolase
MYEITMQLPFDGHHVDGKLTLPVKAKSMIIFSHGFGRSSLMPHEHRMALAFQQAGYGTLVFDTLGDYKDLSDSPRELEYLSKGLLAATNWLHSHSEYNLLDIAYCGNGTGAGPALRAASELGEAIKAVICLGGRIDLEKTQLSEVSVPTLLIVGELDFETVGKNKKALSKLNSPKQLAVIPGASHLFEEPDKLNETAHIAVSWYRKYLASGKEKSETFFRPSV